MVACEFMSVLAFKRIYILALSKLVCRLNHLGTIQSSHSQFSCPWLGPLLLLRYWILFNLMPTNSWQCLLFRSHFQKLHMSSSLKAREWTKMSSHRPDRTHGLASGTSEYYMRLLSGSGLQLNWVLSTQLLLMLLHTVGSLIAVGNVLRTDISGWKTFCILYVCTLL